MIAALLIDVALATPSFDPATPAHRYDGQETFTQDGSTKLWHVIERWQDPNPTLFTGETFNSATEWHDADFSPWIRTAFASARPSTSTFLLHAGPSEEVAHGTPILYVPGAGDNASRGFIGMATHEDRLGRPVYAITFAHPHGDVFQQAEVIADAIAVIKQRTGAAQVDLVAHSKGGIAAVIYASNAAGTDWGTTTTAQAYEQVGTAYRGDVRRLVLIATPLGGIDTGYRWTANNLAGLTADSALAPVSWNTYCSSGVVFVTSCQDLKAQDFLPANGDLFPGQRQLLARQAPALPWTMSWLGGYALAQVDNQTTYAGGTGLYSVSDGIDAAIAAGGGIIAQLKQHGVDPNVELYLLAGSNPIMPNGSDDLAQSWASMNITEDDWTSFLQGITDHGVPVHADEDELDGLSKGQLILGEVTGKSDGLVFETSALDEAAITHRGAVVVGTHTANLSHLDLLYASPITGQLLIDAANSDGDPWERGVGKRYTAEDTIGWAEGVLADEADTDTTDTSDTSNPNDTDTTDTGGHDTSHEPGPRPCGGCDSTTLAAGWLGVLGAIIGMRRRR